MRKRILSMLLACSLVLALVPVTVYADRVYCSVCGKFKDVTLSDYVYADGEYHQQYATCNGCGKIYSAGLSKHSGSGTATCDTGIKCDLCGGEFGALGHDWGEWTLSRGGKHYRFCKRNNKHVDSGVCSASGTVTCDSTATCVTCGFTFPILHLWSSWTFVGNGSHTRTCSRCAKTEKGECVGATRTCTAGSTCDSCGATQPALGHIWSDWKSGGQGAHIRTCSRDSRHYESEQCSGGTPTCVGTICSVCGQTYGRGNPKYHAYVETVTKEATCTENGVMTYVCKYNSSHTKTETIDALDHDRVPHQAQAPTCTEIGWDEYDTCKRCNYTTYQELPALSHSIVHHGAQAPTCTEVGWDEYDACKRCEYTTYVEQPIDSSNHDLEHHAAKAPTCTEVGWDEYDTCKRCEYTTYVGLPIDSSNHDLEHHAAKAPTCTEIGWNEYDTCKRCNYTTYKKLPALNHDRVHHDAKTPTCTETGWDAYDTCKRCEYTTYVEQPIDSGNHDLVHHDAKTPTCTAIGWDEYDTCKRCEYTTYVEQPIDSGNHDLVHHDAKAPTCTEIGWDEYDTCTRCDYTTYAEFDALEHDYQQTIVKPTCEKDGYTRHTCARCEDTYTEDAVEKLYHWYGEWSPNGDETHSADCRREGCKHTGKTGCQKFKFQVKENECLAFCPVCGEVENGERLELIAKALVTVVTGRIPAGEVVARMHNEYLSIAFEYAGKLIAPTGQVKITLPAELLEGKILTLIAPDGTETEIHFEIDGEKAFFTLDFTEAEIPVMLIRTNPEA